MKYDILIDEEYTIIYNGRILHRIRALKDFDDVKTGDIGGYVQTEDNLSQYGNCWIYDNAKCMDKAKCTDDSKMYDNSRMYNNSKMCDYSRMFGNSEMCDNSRMCDYSRMCDNSRMCDDSRMFDNSIMYNNSTMCDDSRMFGYSSLHGNAEVYDNAVLKNNNKLYGVINKPFKKIFQHQCEKRFLTAILTEENEILYSIGCQIGITKEEFIDRIYNDCEIKGNGLIEYPYRQEYLDMIDIIENYFEKFM